MAQPPWLRIEGARQNNLKNVSVDIPHDRRDRHHGRLGIGQVLARLRHPVRRGPVALHRVALHLRAHVPRAARPARRRPDRAHPPRHRPRAEEPRAHGALHGRHRHRGPRLPAAALREDRPRPLPRVRGGGTRAIPPDEVADDPAPRPPGRAGPGLLPPARLRGQGPPPPSPPCSSSAASRGSRSATASSTSPTRAAGPPRCRRRATASGSAWCSTAWSSDPRPARRLTDSARGRARRRPGRGGRARSSAAPSSGRAGSSAARPAASR